MWHRILMMSVLILGITHVKAQNSVSSFDFRYYLNLMGYGAKGKTIDDYKKHASKLGLNLVHHSEEKSELYLVWAENLAYEKGYMSESYAPVGDNPRCLNLDLTPNGKNRYSPIAITLVFPDERSQQAFWHDGLKLGCQEVAKIEPTDVDSTWAHVRELRYIGNAKTQVSWRIIIFYEKDDLFMCTFLF